MDCTIYNTRVQVPEIVPDTGYLYDDVLLKPNGGTASERIIGGGKNRRRRDVLFRCRKPIQVGTMNVLTAKGLLLGLKVYRLPMRQWVGAQIRPSHPKDL